MAWEYGGVGNLSSAYPNVRGLGVQRGSSLAAQYQWGQVHPNLAMFGHLPRESADGGAAAGAYVVPGADHVRSNAGQPLLPQRIMDHPFEGYYIGDWRDRARDEVRGRERSSKRAHSSRSSSGGRHRAAQGTGNRQRGVERYDDTEDSGIEEADDAEMAARVEGVEEELRTLAEDTQERNTHVNEQVTRALAMAEKIGSGPSLATLKPKSCASLVKCTCSSARTVL
jgi:hypothetical protein